MSRRNDTAMSELGVATHDRPYGDHWHSATLCISSGHGYRAMHVGACTGLQIDHHQHAAALKALTTG